MKYFATGKKIREQPGFESTNIGFLDSNSQGVSSFFERNPAKVYLPSNVVVEKPFIALAAPSLEGKTQSAFTFTKAKCLYFVAFKVGDDSQEVFREQMIYRCYADHGRFLRSLASRDIEKINTINRNTGPKTEISASWLMQNRSTPLLVLGYWLALIKLALGVPHDDWMKVYAELEELDVVSVSLEIFEKKLKELGMTDSVCVFIDEFVGGEWTTYSRNLARAASLVCVVANTNSNIANLVGATSCRSGDENEKIIWSVVFNRLNQILPGIVDQYANKLEIIRLKCVDIVGDPQTRKLFDDIFIHSLQRSRPGVVEYVLSAVDKLAVHLISGTFEAAWSTFNNGDTDGAHTLANFIQFIATSVYSALIGRKIGTMNTGAGALAKIGLLHHSAYRLNTPVSNSDYYFNYHRFLKDHFYYLINPVQYRCPIFVTFKMDSKSEYLQLFLPEMNTGADVEIPYDWDIPFTTFPAKDFWAILACLNIPFKFPTGFIMTRSFFKMVTSENGVTDASNSSALLFPGNHFEVLSEVAIVDSTHHPHCVLPNCSLTGQDGHQFLLNLIKNLIPRKLEQNYLVNLVAENNCSSFHEWLKTIRLPFLYSVNHVNMLLDRLSKNSAGGAFIGKYERTRNRDMIDGKFRFKEKTASSARFVMRNIVIECKNHAKPVNVTMMHQILRKAAIHRPRLILVICPALELPSQDSYLIDYCHFAAINMYHVVADYKNFRLKQYSPLIPLHDTPKYNVLVLSMNDLSSDFIHEIEEDVKRMKI